MLLSPDRALSADDDLRSNHAVDARLYGLRSAPAQRVTNPREIAAILRDILQQPENVHRPVVIIGRGVVITAGQWKDLGPAAVRLLGGEQVCDAPLDRFLIP